MLYTPVMLPPVVERELRVALLRRRAHEQWIAAAWIGGAITCIYLLSLAMADPFVGTSGRGLFRCLFALQLFLIVGRGFKLTADLFSEERRDGTLGLLVLTGMKPLEIFSGKLLGAALLTAHAMLGTLPYMAVPFLAGGVTGFQFVAALVTLLNVLLFCISLGLLASIASQEGGHARVISLAIATSLCLVAPLMYWTANQFAGVTPLAKIWLTLSPGFAPWLVWKGFTGGSTQPFWTACGVTWLYSLLCLLIAACLLDRTWRDSPDEFARRRPVWRWQDWRRGSSAWRRRLKAHLLEQQPFAWLIARNRRLVLPAWLFVGLVALGWVGILAVLGRNRPVIVASIIASIVLHQGLNWFLAYSAALPMSEERQSRGFEVLLTTPLKVESIIAGQQSALALQFKKLLLAARWLDGIFLCSAFVFQDWSWPADCWYALVWIGWMAGWTVAHRVTPSMAMWVGAWTGRPAYAAMIAMRPMILLMLTLMPVKSPLVLAEKLARELRLIACAPIPARGDHRFASWNPVEIFPPGRWGDLPLREPSRKKIWPSSARLFASRRRNKRT